MRAESDAEHCDCRGFLMQEKSREWIVPWGSPVEARPPHTRLQSHLALQFELNWTYPDFEHNETLSQFIVPQWKTLICHDQFPTSIKLRVFYMK